VKRIRQYVGDEPFMLTYGDGVSNVDIGKLVAFHQAHGKIATLTSVQPTGRFGALELDNHNVVTGFQEKPQGDGGWINGGFFVLQPEVFDTIADDSTIFERGPMEKLAQQHELVAYKHDGFWQPMDTMRDKDQLENLWQTNKAPWKIWE
ncbi:MAG: glucose-phosphate cytidylyltransferase, partial [Firmicutes bacterium]|nr:glucose-phosphate cytidylyltransferase [Bacillota bacterium]